MYTISSEYKANARLLVSNKMMKMGTIRFTGDNKAGKFKRQENLAFMAEIDDVESDD